MVNQNMNEETRQLKNERATLAELHKLLERTKKEFPDNAAAAERVSKAIYYHELTVAKLEILVIEARGKVD